VRKWDCDSASPVQSLSLPYSLTSEVLGSWCFSCKLWAFTKFVPIGLYTSKTVNLKCGVHIAKKSIS
jgi:hypothetical protein